MKNPPGVVHLVINPNAGKRTAVAAAELAVRTLTDARMDVRSHTSRNPGETRTLAAAIAREVAGTSSVNDTHAPDSAPDAPVAPVAVVAVGGDGTLFDVINGVIHGDTADAGTGSHAVPAGVVFGQIPVGTGNSFIRDLEIHDAHAAIQAILQGNTRPVDLGILSCATGEYSFVNLLGAGFVSAVAHGAAQYKRWGALSYIIAVLRETVRLSPGAMTLTVDGSRTTTRAIFVEICNSRYTGGAMLMAPDARIDDGLLDIVYMEGTTRRKLLTLFPRIFSGRHVEDPVIHVVRGSAITVETDTPWLLTPDGETFGTTPITVGVRPQALQMICP